MPAESTDRGRHVCIPTEIHTDVVKAKVTQEGALVRKIHVFKDVKEIDFCAAEPQQARVEVKEDGWAVSVLFKILVGIGPHRHEHVVKTVALFKTRIPFPSASPPKPIDFRRLEAKVKVVDLECRASIGEDEHLVIAELTFKIVVLALEDEIITVCQLRPHDR
jgi:hypothetical protein